MGETAGFVVMIVESDPHLNYLMQHYARRSGCRPLIAGIDEHVPTLARQVQPAAILLGIEPAGQSGADVLHALKADRVTRDIPIVTCSWGEQGNGGQREGTAGHLQKPVRYRDFLAALESAGVRLNGRLRGDAHRAAQEQVKRESR